MKRQRCIVVGATWRAGSADAPKEEERSTRARCGAGECSIGPSVASMSGARAQGAHSTAVLATNCRVWHNRTVKGAAQAGQDGRWRGQRWGARCMLERLPLRQALQTTIACFTSLSFSSAPSRTFLAVGADAPCAWQAGLRQQVCLGGGAAHTAPSRQGTRIITNGVGAPGVAGAVARMVVTHNKQGRHLG